MEQINYLKEKDQGYVDKYIYVMACSKMRASSREEKCNSKRCHQLLPSHQSMCLGHFLQNIILQNITFLILKMFIFFLQNIREKSIKLISRDLFFFLFLEVPLCLLEAGGPVVVPSFIEVSEMRKYLPTCGYLE